MALLNPHHHEGTYCYYPTDDKETKPSKAIIV